MRRISDKARPIQSREASPLRFSQRSTAMRTWSVEGREQEAMMMVAPSVASSGDTARTSPRGNLQDTRFPRHDLLELGGLAQRLELGFFQQLLPFLEALFQRLTDVLQRTLVHAGFGVGLG